MEANAILQAVKIAQLQAQKNGAISIPTNPLAECGLDNMDCPQCRNTGYIAKVYPDGTLTAEKCPCMAKRVSIRNLERSGLKDLIKRYTFKSYETPDTERRHIKAAAERFGNDSTGWWFISGKSGSGKSHICVAICSALMDRGQEVRYMLWRDMSTELKALVNDQSAYEARMKKLKTVKVLYVDDFLKGGASEADIRLAFEIVNSRYNDSSLRTVISSERDLTQILDLDEALGGRIYERAKGYVMRSPAENWRLK